MTPKLDVLFTPADFLALAGNDLSRTICVVFDVFRATSTIVTALAHGATSIIPVAEISDAMAIRRRRPEVLLAGERDGLRIRADLAGGIDFDLGNSPREFTFARIGGKTIVLTTTNGSRALRACARAQFVLIGSFLNLQATADWLRQRGATRVLLVCSGTGNQAAFEDVLGAGALVELLMSRDLRENFSDSANVALQIYQQHSRNLPGAVEHSRNGRRLLALPDLRDDVALCFQRDTCSFVASLHKEIITKID